MTKNSSHNSGPQKAFWKTKPISDMSHSEWESLCDGCGKCCLNKLENDDTGEVHYTKIACRLLDNESCKCSQYSIRHQFVPDCIVLTPKILVNMLIGCLKPVLTIFFGREKIFLIGIHLFRAIQILFMKQTFQ